MDRNGGMWSTDPTGDIVVLPLDRLRVPVVLLDVAQELAAEVAGGGEDAAGDDIALDLAQPDLDLVEPAGVARREVQPDVAVKAQELLHAFGLVGRKVVEDDVDLSCFLARLATTAPKKATNSSLVWLATVLPITSPVLVLSAA